MLLSLATILALAGTPEDDQAAAHTQAEYVRMSTLIQDLAERNAWAGVERNYRELRSFGVPLSFEDHLAGAYSARALGDATSLRQRLKFARALNPDNDEIEGWIVEIKRNYGEVHLQCDPSKGHLKRKGMPFDPNQVAAIQFAQQQVESRGTFEGLMPAGEYTFHSFDFTVQPGMQSASIDARTTGYMRALERQERIRDSQYERKKQKKDSGNTATAP